MTRNTQVFKDVWKKDNLEESHICSPLSSPQLENGKTGRSEPLNSRYVIHNSGYPDVYIFSKTLAPALEFLRLQKWWVKRQAGMSRGPGYHLERGLLIAKNK